MQLRSIALICSGLLMTAAVPSIAAYGGLISIPTADTVGAHFYSMEWQGDGSLPDRTSDARMFNTQIGFSDRLEAGIDLDMSDDENGESTVTPIFNAKYVFKIDEQRQFSLAAGIHSVQRDAKAVPYVVATKCLGRAGRVHLGGLRCEGRERWFVGADRAIGDRWTLMADYTNGEENTSSAGVNYQMSENYAIVVGAQFPNDGSETTYTVHFAVGGNYRSCPAD